jgi:hypothetical protein
MIPINANRRQGGDVAANRIPLGSVVGGKAYAEGGGVSDAGHPAARSLAQLESSQSAMRDTTKWLVAAAATVGAVVVAGLQLSKIPAGDLATVLSLGGFAFALAGVAWILFSAAGVLSAGYTTIGELADLKSIGPYEQELRREAYWNDQIGHSIERARDFEKEPGRRRGPLEVLKRVGWLAAGIIFVLMKWVRVHYAKDEGIRIDEMLKNLD